jgi:hypothetical protein
MQSQLSFARLEMRLLRLVIGNRWEGSGKLRSWPLFSLDLAIAFASIHERIGALASARFTA